MLHLFFYFFLFFKNIPHTRQTHKKTCFIARATVLPSLVIKYITSSTREEQNEIKKRATLSSSQFSHTRVGGVLLCTHIKKAHVSEPLV